MIHHQRPSIRIDHAARPEPLPEVAHSFLSRRDLLALSFRRAALLAADVDGGGECGGLVQRLVGVVPDEIFFVEYRNAEVVESRKFNSVITSGARRLGTAVRCAI